LGAVSQELTLLDQVPAKGDLRDFPAGQRLFDVTGVVGEGAGQVERVGVVEDGRITVGGVEQDDHRLARDLHQRVEEGRDVHGNPDAAVRDGRQRHVGVTVDRERRADEEHRVVHLAELALVPAPAAGEDGEVAARGLGDALPARGAEGPARAGRDGQDVGDGAGVVDQRRGNLPRAWSTRRAAPRLEASGSGEVITRWFSASASIWVHAGEWINWPPVAITHSGRWTTRWIADATVTSW